MALDDNRETGGFFHYERAAKDFVLDSFFHEESELQDIDLDSIDSPKELKEFLIRRLGYSKDEVSVINHENFEEEIEVLKRDKNGEAYYPSFEVQKMLNKFHELKF